MTAPVTHGEMTHGGETRSWRLFDPDPGGADTRPLVLLLHGGGGSGDTIARIARFEPFAAEQGLLVASPDGINGSWNDGRAVVAGRDDVGFLLALAERLVAEHRADPARLYAVGASNGGMMAMRLANDAADRLAAIATVIAAMPEELAERFAPPVPVPIVMVNGDADPVLPFDGGAIRIQRQVRGRVLSTPETAARWAAQNGCDPAPETDYVDLPDAAPMRVRRERHAGGTGGAETVLYVVEGGGHTWPGGEQYMPEWVIGKTCREFDANRVLWEFLQRFRRA